MFYDVFRLLGFVPGLEFKVAMTEAKKLNIPVVYGDQEASVRLCANALLWTGSLTNLSCADNDEASIWCYHARETHQPV